MNDEILEPGAPFRMAKPKIVSDGPAEAKRGPGRPRKVEEQDTDDNVVVTDSPLVVLRTIAQLLKQYEYDRATQSEIIKTLACLLDT